MERIQKNLVVSTASGLLRSLVPAVLAVVLYPLLLHAGGLELVGRWSVLQLIVSYLALCGAGLPSLLTRMIAADTGEGEPIADAVGVVLAGYLVTGAGLTAILVVFAAPIWHLLQLPPDDNVEIIVGAAAAAGVAGTIAVAYGSILTGVHRLYVAQTIETMGSIVQFAVAVLFIVVGRPNAGLPVALLAGKLTSLALAGESARRGAGPYVSLRPRFRLGHFLSLLGRAKGFMFLDTGYTLLPPIVRGLIAVMAGPSELAVFDIGNRLPSVIRNLFIGGMMALFPAIAALSAEERREAIGRVMRAGLAVSVFLIVAPLAVYWMLAQPMLFLWIGNVGAQVGEVTIAITIAQIASAYTISFYFALQALGGEAAAAYSVWLQVAVVLLGSLAFFWIGISAAHFAWLLLIAGVVSQVQLGIEAQRRAQLLTATFRRPRDYLAVLISFAFIFCAAYLEVDATSGIAWGEVGRAATSFLILWTVSLGILTGGHPVRFLRWTLRTAPEGGR